jgi:hypothetical protein
MGPMSFWELGGMDEKVQIVNALAKVRYGGGGAGKKKKRRS